MRDRPAKPSIAAEVLAPMAALLASLIAGALAYGAARGAGAAEDPALTLAQAVPAAALLAIGWGLWRRLPAHRRRLVIRRPGAGGIGRGALAGVGLAIGAAAIAAAGLALDAGARERNEDAELVLGDAAWQVGLTLLAVVVLAPLGEELIFRGLLLRALARRLAPAAAIVASAALFAAAHVGAYAVWPRLVALFAIGVGFALVYRRHGFWSAVACHMTLNAIAAAGALAGVGAQVSWVP